MPQSQALCGFQVAPKIRLAYAIALKFVAHAPSLKDVVCYCYAAVVIYVVLGGVVELIPRGAYYLVAQIVVV